MERAHTQQHDGGGDQHMQQHMQEMRAMHQNTLWVHFANVALGFWLLMSPFTFGYTEAGHFPERVYAVTAERGLADPLLRAQWLAWSDMVSGALIIVFASLSVFWKQRWAQWGSCFVGLWLLAAPLLLWSPSAAAYNNDTLVGSLVIAFAVLVPMMPGMSMQSMMAKDDIPPGWDYSPSSWSQRLPIIGLAFVGFFIARYLSAYQLGHIEQVWEPFFVNGGAQNGTQRIITSDVSRAWPVADAGLGALSYLLEALSGMMGDRRRWRTMPWMVGMFGFLVIPLGGVSIFFIVIQPIVIGTWCTLCLISAAAMVIMLPYSFDEIVAMFQFMKRTYRDGKGIWKPFWHGGAIAGGTESGEPPLRIDVDDIRALDEQFRALPKGLFLCAVLGLWLMFTRLIFGTEGAMADSDHFIGAMVFTFSIAAFSEVARPLRALNFLFGGWLLIAPWLLDGGTAAGTVGSLVVGTLIILFTLPRGPVRHRYDGWDRLLAW